MEPLAPADFFRRVGELLARGEATVEGAEVLRLAYLANPLNPDAHKDQVREAPLLPPPPPAATAEPEPAPEPATPVPTPRRRRAERPASAPAPTPIDPQERDELLAAFRPTDRGASAEEATAAWQAAQVAFQAGQWEETRRLAQQAGQHPEFQQRAQELLRTIDRQEDFVLPQLNGLAAGLTSARRREAWQDVDQIWEKAQAIVEEQHRQGVPTRLPPTLVEQYSRAKNAQEAKPLVQEAVRLRRQGAFVESDSLLAEAVKLDPDNAVILAERERCSLGITKLTALQGVMGKAHVTVNDLMDGVEDAAALEQLAPEGADVVQMARNFRRLREDTADRLAQRADQLLDEIERRPGIGEKWSLCGETSRCVDDLLRLAPERPEVARLESRLESLSGQVTRAQDLIQGLNTSLDAARSGGLLTPITAGRLAADLAEAQSIAPDDLSLRSIGTRVAEAISVSLSSPEYLVRDPARFDLTTFYSTRELIRLLVDLPGGPSLQTLEGYRHSLVTRTAEAVLSRLERGLAEDHTAAAQGAVEEALQLALALSSLPGPEALQAAAELVDRVTERVRRWIYHRFIGAPSIDEVERIASQVADMLVHLRSLPNTPADTHADLEREFTTSIHQAVRHQIGPEMLANLSVEEGASRVARANEFITYGLPPIMQRLGHPERARAAALLESLALAQEQVDQRQSRSTLIRAALPIAGAAAALVAVLAMALPALRSSGPANFGTRTFAPEAQLAGDCVFLDGHNICNEANGPQFRTVYQRPRVAERLGSPLSGKLNEGRDVQYFQYGRLEYHPNNPPPYDYQYGLLGTELAHRQMSSDGALRAGFERPPDPAGRTFVDTNHSVGDRNGFLAYFNENGGVEAFGYPITEEYVKDGTVFQWFQRGRFERRPGEATVRPGQVGLEYLKDILGARVCHRLLGNASECQ